MNNNDGKISILVVDDSDIIRHSLKNFFTDYNLDVITSHDGLDGIQKATEHKPSLIFLDLMMPNFDGVKMLQVIKVLDNLKSIPVIVISGNTNRSNVLAAIEAGAERVISKPLQKEIIIKNINELLGNDFLAKSKKAKVFSNSETIDIKKQLCGYFLKSFPDKKKIIIDSLQKENREALRNVVHELRGAGGAIGYPKLTILSGVIEDQITSSNFNWGQIKIMCDQIFSIVNEMEESNTILEE